MTIRFDGPFTYATTALPCPSWCELAPSHEMMHSVGEVTRHHTQTFGTQPSAVELFQYETAESTDGPLTSAHTFIIVSAGLENVELTSVNARHLAAALLNAADALDRVAPNA